MTEQSDPDGWASAYVEVRPRTDAPGCYQVFVDGSAVGYVTARSTLTGFFGAEPIDGYVASDASHRPVAGVYGSARAAALWVAASSER